MSTKEYYKKYYQQNKERLLTAQKIYAEENKEIIAERRLQYRQENPELISEQRKKFYYNNQIKINTPHECTVCGGRYTSKHISQHKKTKKHINALSFSTEQIL